MNLSSLFPKNDWYNILSGEFSKQYWHHLEQFLNQEMTAGKKILPSADQLFRCFSLTSYEQARVVILGQDPYHGMNQAIGLSFAVSRGTALPPSLKNIYKELQRDLELPPPTHGDLSFWAQQGVLLLNTVLTVEEGCAGSHSKHGWEQFTDQVIKKLNDHQRPIVFVLWGNPAQAKEKLIDGQRHYILKAAHPSPLAAHRGFFNCHHFSKINQWLKANGQSTIDWTEQPTPL